MSGDSTIRAITNYVDSGDWKLRAGAKKTAAEATTSNTTQAADSVEISSAGGLLGSLKEGLFWGVKPRTDGAIHVEDIEKAYDDALSRFNDKLAALLEQKGIDRSEDAVLQSDANGKIIVVGDHPDKAEIEALFEENPEMANEFRHLSGTASMLSAADEAKAFLTDYAKNPEAAVQRWWHLFSNNRDRQFQIRITDEEMLASVVK